KHPLINEIDRWEQHSINLIRKTAEEARQKMKKHTTEHLSKMEKNLNDLTKRLREGRGNDDFVEIDLQQWNQQLTQINEELMKPTNIKVKQSSTPLITMINVEIFDKNHLRCVADTDNHRVVEWKKGATTGRIVAGENEKEQEIDQVLNPLSLSFDEENNFYVNDLSNNRIEK
ncbi:unnamed protein product, partial [Adineta ricciae]